MLSQRLNTLVERGLIERKRSNDQRSWEYHLTQAGRELEPTVMRLGEWGARWVRSQMSKDDLSVELLMWDMRRTINTSALPPKRTVLHFEFTDLDKKYKNWWMLSENNSIDLCVDDPGFEPDVTFLSDLKTMTQLWLGDITLSKARSSGKLNVSGSSRLTRNIPKWLVFSGFSGIKSGFSQASA